MSRGIDALRNSRLARAIGELEQGGEVDWIRYRTLRALDAARDGQLAAADALEREEAADADYERILAG